MDDGLRCLLLVVLLLASDRVASLDCMRRTELPMLISLLFRISHVYIHVHACSMKPAFGLMLKALEYTCTYIVMYMYNMYCMPVACMQDLFLEEGYTFHTNDSKWIFWIG